MPKIRKTSTQPKRKPKKLEPIIEKIYPEFIENFKKEVKEKTSLLVKADQYSEGSAYHVGVLKKTGKVYRCIWMTNFATESSHLAEFWKSQAYKELSHDQT